MGNFAIGLIKTPVEHLDLVLGYFRGNIPREFCTEMVLLK